MSAFDANVSGGSLDGLITTLRGLHGPEARREARKAVRRAMKPAVQELQQAIRSTPGRAPAGDLRESIARAIAVSATATGVRIQVNSARLGDKRRLPELIESGSWRHPVHGNRQRWVSQRGEAWFHPTLDRYDGRLRPVVLDAVAHAVREALG